MASTNPNTNATSFFNISSTTSPQCSTLYGGTNLAVPAFVIPTIPRYLNNSFIVVSIAQGTNQNALAVLDILGENGDGLSWTWPLSCYVWGPILFGENSTDRTHWIDGLNNLSTPYIVVSGTQQVAEIEAAVAASGGARRQLGWKVMGLLVAGTLAMCVM